MTAVVSPRPLAVAGTASLAVRQPPPPASPARVIVARPDAVDLELPPSAAEPRAPATAAGMGRLPTR